MFKVQSRVHTKQLFGRSGIFASVWDYEQKKTRKKRNLSLIKHWKFEWFIMFKFRTTKKYKPMLKVRKSLYYAVLKIFFEKRLIYSKLRCY